MSAQSCKCLISWSYVSSCSIHKIMQAWVFTLNVKMEEKGIWVTLTMTWLLLDTLVCAFQKQLIWHCMLFRADGANINKHSSVHSSVRIHTKNIKKKCKTWNIIVGPCNLFPPKIFSLISLSVGSQKCCTSAKTHHMAKSLWAHCHDTHVWVFPKLLSNNCSECLCMLQQFTECSSVEEAQTRFQHD